MAKKSRVTMKRYEKSAADRRQDKRSGAKEGSRADMRADRAGVRKANKARGY